MLILKAVRIAFRQLACFLHQRAEQLADKLLVGNALLMRKRSPVTVEKKLGWLCTWLCMMTSSRCLCHRTVLLARVDAIANRNKKPGLRSCCGMVLGQLLFTFAFP